MAAGTRRTQRARTTFYELSDETAVRAVFVLR